MFQLITDRYWYRHNLVSWLLFPFALVFQMFSVFRRWYLCRFKQKSFSVPVIVVGNLTVGGVGKTPLVISLAQAIKSRGIRVGIVSRGYGCNITSFPYEILSHSKASEVGDEPFLMAKNTGCPVVIAPNRSEAVRYLIEKHDIQIVLSDDGLQHYKMGREMEIAVIDVHRGLGNGLYLPAGPLREGPNRLKTVDFIIANGGAWPDAYSMSLEPGAFVQLTTSEVTQVTQLQEPIVAIAGIGHPARFFNTLKELGLSFTAYPFPDHHRFQQKDFKYFAKSILMTEKDAVKCHELAHDSMFYLPVNAKLSPNFWEKFWSHSALKDLC